MQDLQVHAHTRVVEVGIDAEREGRGEGGGICLLFLRLKGGGLSEGCAGEAFFPLFLSLCMRNCMFACCSSFDERSKVEGSNIALRKCSFTFLRPRTECHSLAAAMIVFPLFLPPPPHAERVTEGGGGINGA